MAKPLPAIDLKGEERRITAFIRRVVARSGAKGVVVGLSGGVDSAVVLALCVRALGRGGVLAALLPSKHTPPGDTEDAVLLADEWRVRRVSVAISTLVDGLISVTESDAAKLARANVQARIRMTILYYLANSRNLLVVGTGDRSEELLGFFTKFGDGGADFLPIAHLYKTQVRQMGTHLGIPPSIVNKPASPQLSARTHRRGGAACRLRETRRCHALPLRCRGLGAPRSHRSGREPHGRRTGPGDEKEIGPQEDPSALAPPAERADPLHENQRLISAIQNEKAVPEDSCLS